MKIKLLYIVFALFVFCGSSHGQLLQWNTFGNAGTETTEPSVFNNTNITASNLTLGAGVTAAGNGNRFGGRGWWNTGNTATGNTIAEAVAGNDYIQFIVTPNTGYSFTPTSFVFTWDRSGTGPSNVALRSSADGYVANLGTVTGIVSISGSTPLTVNTITISGLTNLATATTFRIYGYGATATGGTGGFDINPAVSIVNVTLNGTTTASGITSDKDGPWTTPATWVGGVVPTSSQNVIIAHNVTTGAVTRDSGTTTTVNAGANLAVSGTYTNNGTTTINGTFQIDNNGFGGGANDFVYGANATLIYNHNSGSFYGPIDGFHKYWPSSNGPTNVTVSANSPINLNVSRTVSGLFQIADGVFSANLTLNGTAQINAGGYFNNAPIYGNASTLVYNVGATYGVNNEWTGNSTTAGTGIPQNVTIQNGTTLNMPNGNRGLAGNLSVNSGSLNLNASSGDLYVAGNWSRASTASFNPNNRAVFFNGSTTQNVTVAATGTETFNFLLVQGSGTVKLATGTNMAVTATNGLTLASSNGTSTIDLNGQTLTLSGGGNLSLSSGNRKITSTVPSGSLSINSNTITITNGGTLSTDTNTIVKLQNGLDCNATSLLTINGTLQINVNGFCVGNSPRYGASSLLQYNSSGSFSRTLEWTVDTAPIGTIGFPNNVQISSNTTLEYYNATNLGPKGINGNLVIDFGSAFNFGAISTAGALSVGGDVSNAGTLNLGVSAGDDLKLGGNFTNTGIFNGNNRAVFFTKNGSQTISSSSALTIPYVVFQPASGNTTVQLLSNLIVSAPLGGNAISFNSAIDVFDLNSKSLTIGTASVANAISGVGTFKGSTGSNMTLLGTGSIGILNFTAGSQNLATFTITRTAGVLAATLGTNLNINSLVQLNSGLLDIAGFNLTLSAGATIGGTPSISNFIIANGTGQLVKTFSSAGSFVYPIGDNTGALDYSPVTLTFAGGTYGGTVGVKVTDAIHPNNEATVDYLTRYWSVSASGVAPASYTFAGTYAVSGDVNGTESNIKPGRFDGTNWVDVGVSAIGSTSCSVSGTSFPATTNDFSAGSPLQKQEINIQQAGTNYLTTSTYAFGNQAMGTSSSAITFTIQNLGQLNLTLDSTPKIIVSGTNAAEFTVNQTTTTSPITPNSSTTFTVTFTPSITGAKTATLTIANNDLNEGSYVINLTGTGTSNPAGYFRSAVAGGSWATPASWQSSTDNVTWLTSTLSPDNTATSITIRNGFNINSSGNVTADDITIDAGATLTVSGGTFTLNNGTAPTDMQINGTFTYSGGTFTQNSSAGIAFAAGATYNHQSTSLTLPVATWNITSNCNITGVSLNSPAYSGTTFGQTFGNFTWNNAGQTSSGYMNIDRSAFSVTGTLTIGPSANNLFSFGNLSATYTNTVNRIVVTGGNVNCAGAANVTLNVTNDVSVSGGFFNISGGAGTAITSIGTDLSISGTGTVNIINLGSSPSTTLNIGRDLLISGIDPQLNLESTSSSGVATVNIARNFNCSSSGTTYAAVDFGTGAVANNVINIKGNFSKSGNGSFETASSTQALGFSFNGTGTQTFSYSGIDSYWTSYIVQSGSTVQLNSNLTLGINTNPPSWFTVSGTLNFGTNSIIAGNSSDPRFIASAGSTLISSNTAGFGGTTAAGSIQSFGNVGSASAAGRATFIAGANYTFNGNTITPFPNGTFGNPATINVNASITSNMTIGLIVTSAINVNNGGTFALNSTNNNNVTLNNAVLNVFSGGIFDNNGENQIIKGTGTPSISITGKFITRDVQGFVGLTSAIPSIVPVLNAGSTVEYGLNGDQAVQGSTAPNYQNVTFSGSGTKTLASSCTVTGTILVTDTAILDVENKTMGGTGTNLTMTGTSEYRTAGIDVKPDAGGVYSLGVGTKVSFTSGSISNPIATLESIRLAPNYYNIDIIGNNVGTNTLASALKIQNGGTFTVKSTGIFKHINTSGFNGSTTTAISNINSPTIILDAGSTIEYAGANQVITTVPNYYKNLNISGTGVKTLSSVTETRADEDLNILASKLLVEEDKVITVKESVNVTPTTGIFEIENNGQLIQIDDNALNTGIISYERKATVKKYDYVYWSSPVEDFDMSGIASYVQYGWDTTAPNANGGEGNWVGVSGNMAPGKGYIFRVPNSISTTASADNFTSIFSGTPLNGIKDITIYRGNDYTGNGTLGTPRTESDDNWNLIGNPYPSAIGVNEFLDNNSAIEGFINVWTHGTALFSGSYDNPFYQNYTYNYNPNDYIQVNKTGTTSGPGDYKIGAGQGFFVLMNAGSADSTKVSFKNSLRSKDFANNQFYKNNNVINERNRIWLDLNSTVSSTRILVGYVSGATNDKDRTFDAFTENKGDQNFYSLLSDEFFKIQGRALPFNENDTVPLGVNIITEGNYIIAIAAVDGLFSDASQSIYLEDKLLNIIHDLKRTPYTFTAAVGEFNERFVLRYNNSSTLSTADFDSANQVVITTNESRLTITSKAEAISKVQIFDMLGRRIYDKKNVDSNIYSIADLVKNQVLIVKVKLQNGHEMSNKVIVK